MCRPVLSGALPLVFYEFDVNAQPKAGGCSEHGFKRYAHIIRIEKMAELGRGQICAFGKLLFTDFAFFPDLFEFPYKDMLGGSFGAFVKNECG